MTKPLPSAPVRQSAPLLSGAPDCTVCGNPLNKALYATEPWHKTHPSCDLQAAASRIGMTASSPLNQNPPLVRARDELRGDNTKLSRSMVKADLQDTSSDLCVPHSLRFRRVSNRYPHRVSEAYEGDLAGAAADDHATVAAKVADWERRNGTTVRDWVAQGRSERGGER